MVLRCYKETTGSCLAQDYLWGRSMMNFCLNAFVNIYVLKDKILIIIPVIITIMMEKERERERGILN